MPQQLSLFADCAFIRCTECGAELRDLDDLHRQCAAQKTGDFHLVARLHYFTLVRRSTEAGQIVLH